jgi:uncharacterized membrane protein YqjE
MESNAPVGAETSKRNTGDSLRNGIASFLRYLELRLKLAGLESKEAGIHLLVLAILFVATVVFFCGFLLMLIVFLLFVLMLLFHWDWGWSALACGGVVLILSIISGTILRFKIARPIFQATMAEIRKEREWLSRTTKNVS